MNPEAESTELELSWTQRAIQRLARAALLILILAITTVVAVPARALTRRDSRVLVNGVQAPGLEGWQRSTVNPLVEAPHSAVGTSTLGPVSPLFGFGSSLRGSAPVGTGPSTLAINPATHTIYVANGYNDNGPELPTPGNTVSVINARDCQAQDVSRCKGPWTTITVGNMPSGIAIDERTDTVYVSNVQDDTVSVFNGRERLGLRADAGNRPRRTGPAWAVRRPGRPHRVCPQLRQRGGRRTSGRQHDGLDDRQRDLQRNRSRGLSDHGSAGG
jgi:hypothetical protein